MLLCTSLSSSAGLQVCHTRAIRWSRIWVRYLSTYFEVPSPETQGTTHGALVRVDASRCNYNGTLKVPPKMAQVGGLVTLSSRALQVAAVLK
jgi:hypothetical protein